MPVFDIFNIFSLFGGLALFLFGMNIMGEGLEKRAGNKLKGFLAALTSSPLKGLFLGVVVTAVIQSSSATTVMVVGFVNSGVMQLNQAVGVIMGANIGTTVTSWLLSLAGIEGDSFIIRLLKPSSFSPVIAAVGIILYMSKKRKNKEIGSIFVGFAILMYGMESMSAAVKPLSAVPEFTNILLLFSNPVFGVIAGAVLTAIIQSSSASVGILQALSATGSVTYGSAIPIIMGQNIGTCVTAIISSIGANKNAKRAAAVHLYFNLIGTAGFLILFYVAKAILRFTFVNSAIDTFGIAIIHTLFNIFSTVVMLPFSKQLVTLANKTVKEKKDAREALVPLDERLLAAPSVAIEQCKKLTSQMAHIAKDTLEAAVGLIGNYSEAAADNVAAGEDKVDYYEDKLGTYLVKLSGLSLSLEESHNVSKMLHSIGDFERISDHAVNIVDSAKEMYDKKISFSGNAIEELKTMIKAVEEITTLAVDSFDNDDAEAAWNVEPLEQVIDFLKLEMRSRHISRLSQGECTIELGFIFSDLISNFERISDHCSNIAVCQTEVDKDKFDTHEYLNEIKTENNEAFSKKFAEYKEKFAL